MLHLISPDGGGPGKLQPGPEHAADKDGGPSAGVHTALAAAPTLVHPASQDPVHLPRCWKVAALFHQTDQCATCPATAACHCASGWLRRQSAASMPPACPPPTQRLPSARRCGRPTPPGARGWSAPPAGKHSRRDSRSGQAQPAKAASMRWGVAGCAATMPTAITSAPRRAVRNTPIPAGRNLAACIVRRQPHPHT